MHNVRLAAPALVLFCAASALAQETASAGEYGLSPEVSFASASGMPSWPSTSPLGGLAFGRVPAPVMTEVAVPAELPAAAAKAAAAQAEEAGAGGMNDARPVPEPPALLMLVAGLGVLGVVISRRQ